MDASELNLADKYQRLRDIITEMGGCVIGFSGGVDSTFLFAVAVDVLDGRALAVTATSATYPERELREARELATLIGGRHRVVIVATTAKKNCSESCVRSPAGKDCPTCWTAPMWMIVAITVPAAGLPPS